MRNAKVEGFDNVLDEGEDSLEEGEDVLLASGMI